MSAPSVSDCPDDSGAEVAFAGRSNAGKSSAINALTRQTKLARISKTPGRTQLINFFTLSGDERLVDLPGYGFAKVPLPLVASWRKMMSEYFAQRQSLRGVVIVMDARHPMKDIDLQMVEWCRYTQIPYHLLLTKADKLSKNQANQQLFNVKKQIAADTLASAQLFSSLKKQGLDELKLALRQWLISEAHTDAD